LLNQNEKPGELKTPALFALAWISYIFPLLGLLRRTQINQWSVEKYFSFERL